MEQRPCGMSLFGNVCSDDTPSGWNDKKHLIAGQLHPPTPLCASCTMHHLSICHIRCSLLCRTAGVLSNSLVSWDIVLWVNGSHRKRPRASTPPFIYRKLPLMALSKPDDSRKPAKAGLSGDLRHAAFTHGC